MHEIERTLWNFMFAARRCAAADAGHASQAEADDIASRAVRDLTTALRNPDPMSVDIRRAGPMRIRVEPSV